MQNHLLLGTRKGLLVYAREGAAWRLASKHFLGIQVSAVLARGGRWWVALRNGHFGPKLHVSDDAGANWQELAVPALPDGPDAKPLDQMWTLAAGGDGTLWAGGIPPGLFRSNDGGASWQLVDALWQRPERTKWFGGGFDDAGIHSVLVDPRDPLRVVVGISCGGVWQTRDGGASWNKAATGMWAAYMPPDSKEDPDIQDPHRLAQCAAFPDEFWCQHHNGQFHSDSNLEHWQEIRPNEPLSNFGFAVVAHPKETGTAWFVPADADQRRIPLEGDFYVLHTRDGGKTFTKHKRGLPPAPAFQLVYRHGLAIDADGNTLAMASTTGSLWLGTEQGASWQRVSADLPPVYCIDFAD